MFTVQLATVQGTCYLCGTVWTFAGARDRATEYATVEQARAALEKAKKFMKATHYKAAQIVENS
jgi:hypothetical protein